LISFLAAPIGSALVHVAVTRALVMVIPAVLFISIGTITFLEWIKKRYSNLSRTFISLSLFIFLASVNFYMLYDILINGPTWYSDYGLGGMQYGGKQVYSAVKEYLEDDPGALISVSPSWANGADVIANFYLSDPIPVQLGNIEHYLYNFLPLEDGRLFVMTADEFEKTTTSGKFTDIQVQEILDYPDGRPGFYFVQLEYVEDIEQILQKEEAVRRELQVDEIVLDGEKIKVRYPLLDMGKIADLWDGDDRSVARTFEANPFVIELTFPEPREMIGVSLVVGDTDVWIDASLYPAEGVQPEKITAELSGSVQEPAVYLDFGGSKQVEVLVLEVRDLLQDEPAHVHLWEIQFD
jgi:hypothetical protein